MGLEVRTRLPELKAALKALSARRVLVGIPAEKAIRRPESAEDRDPINNAALLYIHEHGAPGANIPARPALIPGIASVQPSINAEFKACAAAYLSFRPADVTVTLNRVGLMASQAVKLKITDGPFEPLKPATIAARRRKGYQGTSPLIRTGQMRNAVTYVIRGAPVHG